MNDKVSNQFFSLTAWGGAGTVTGANFEINTGKSRILVDCGLVQGTPAMEEINKNPFGYDPKSFSALLITHSHMDHIGRIPKLIHDGFDAPIYSTAETKAIAEVVLVDELHIAIENAKETNTTPLFDERDLTKALSLWHTIPYHQETLITDDISVVLYDTGHILGSAMYWIILKGTNFHKSILMTGDLGNSPSTLLRDLEVPPGPDYLLMESVYGDRNHEGVEDRVENFKRAILERVQMGGTVLIPAFSIERTQIILSLLNEMAEKEGFRIPVFLDSPLGIRVTQIYEKMSALFNSGAIKEMNDGDGIFRFKTLTETAKVEDSRTIAGITGPKVIIAGSGMSTGGRILAHEKRYLPDENTSVLLMGYQAPGTVGRQLEEGAKRVNIYNESVDIRAKIISIHGFSGHADSNHLLAFTEKLSPKPKKVFVAMGESKASNFLAQRIKDNLDIETKVLTPNEKEIL
ncbi:MAG: MBL fold metallo-hydrolase [Minisyncoccia bacterium]